MSQQTWDDRYAAREAMWSRDPNPTLVDLLTGVTPGRALDAPAGEGSDAVWLAMQGWHVTALDFSSVGLDRTRQAAQAAGIGGRVETLQADLMTWTHDGPGYDLVASHFLQLSTARRTVAFSALAAAVAPGGWLLIVGHHPLDLSSGLRRPPDPDRFFSAEQIAEDLGEGWVIEGTEARPRPATAADGSAATAHDAVLLARREG